MQYFVTGTTGFIGKRLVKKLLERKSSTVYFLIRKESAGKMEALRAYWGASAARVVPVHGDLTARKLGVLADDVKKLKGRLIISTTSRRFMTWVPMKKARLPSMSTVLAIPSSLQKPLTRGTFTM